MWRLLKRDRYDEASNFSITMTLPQKQTRTIQVAGKPIAVGHDG